MTSKRENKVFKSVRVVAAFALLFLTFFLSCNVRKMIQTSLDIPAAKSLNPSKSAVFTAQSCHFFTQTSETSTKESKVHAFLTFAALVSFFFLLTPVQLRTFHRTTRNLLPDSVPLFLRYRKIVI